MSKRDEAISEETALEFFMNGDLAEAIKTYKKLIILYPEKQTYWLSQMELLTRPISEEEKNSYREDLKKWQEDKD